MAPTETGCSAKAPATTAAVGTAPAAEKNGASAPAASVSENDRDPKAMEILLRMANYLAKATSLRVTVLSSYDAIQRDDARDDWQNWAEDERWDHHDGDWDEGGAFLAGAVVGAAARAVAASATQPTYVTTLPCTTTAVVVNGATYYNCSGSWYNRGYSSGTVVYVVTAPPDLTGLS